MVSTGIRKYDKRIAGLTVPALKRDCHLNITANNKAGASDKPKSKKSAKVISFASIRAQKARKSVKKTAILAVAA